QTGDGRLARCGVPAHHASAQSVPGPLGDSRQSVAPPAMVPNPLAAHYSRFRVADRLLLTGHSHQAWPDVGFEAQQLAWLDAADLVDDKWPRAREQAEQVKAAFARLLGR